MSIASSACLDGTLPTSLSSLGTVIDTLMVHALLQVSAVPSEILGLGLFAGAMATALIGQSIGRAVRGWRQRPSS